MNQVTTFAKGDVMTRVILVRHGQTKWNVELKYQGHSEVELTPTGIEQAKLVAGRLAKEPLAAVYSSDLGRARMTAQYIAERHSLPVITVSDLREYHFGEWEGLSFKQIAERWPDISASFFRNPDDIRIPGGETFRDVKARAESAVKRLVSQHPDQTIVIVSHGGTIRTILCAALGLHLNRVWAIKQDNTAVNVIEYHDADSIVALVNDTHHLRES